MHHARHFFLIFACTLLGFGVLMVQSASLTSWPTEAEQIYLSKHLAFLAVGVAAAGIGSVISGRRWRQLSPWLLAATVGLLLAIRVPGIGKTVNGATRWLDLGAFSLQPSEFAKIALPLFVAAGLVADPRRRLGWLGNARLLLPAAVAVGLVLIQPDLGTALFLAVGTGLTLFVGGWPLRNFLLCGLAVIPLLGSAFYLKPYQWERITGFVQTWQDIDQAPYQIKQSFVSISEGGLWGVGLGKGWQKLSYLPEANTDFVFAVVAEELGLVGACGVIVLWVALFVCGLAILRPLPRDSFEFIVGVTLLSQVVLQAALNVAVVTALVPPKGIPHPLLSYGGSNLVVSLISLGLVFSFSRGADEHAETNDIEHAGKTTEAGGVEPPGVRREKVA